MKTMMPCLKKKKSLRAVVFLLGLVVSIILVLKMSYVHSMLFLDLKHEIPSQINSWENMKHVVKNQPLERSGIILNSSYSQWEHELMSLERLKDLLSCGFPNLSKLYFLKDSASNTTQLEEGQSVTVRIDVCNSYNLQQTSGGDEVRVWLVEPGTKTTAFCSITDWKNGSYVANCKALFPGLVNIHAALVYPKEYLRLILAMVHQGLVRFTAGLFERNSLKEVTLCGPSPYLPNYTKVCDLFHENNNMSWYCGHPNNEKLSCSDWQSVRTLPLPKHLPISKAESELIKYIRRPPHVKLIPSNLKLNITSKDPSKKSMPLCSLRTRPLQQSWKEQSPRGWFELSKWQPRTCELYDVTGDRLRLCLSDKTVLLLGDTNQQQIYHILRNMTQCQEDNKDTKWPQTRVCSRQEWKMKIMSIPHELPLILEETHWTNKTFLSAVEAINEIPSAGKHIVFLHHFLDLTPFHHSIFRERLSKTRDALSQLLKRNPQIFIAVRGPHFVEKSQDNHIIGGDHFAGHFSDIVKEEFVDLQSDILFIDGLDMSSAVESQNVLPHVVRQEITRLLLAYACDFFLTYK